MIKLYRPVGFKELDLILNTGNKRFPPRLPEQPFFYPVLMSTYAEEIAKEWNTKDIKSGYVGYVTEFDIDDQYIRKFEIHTVGSSKHKEFWVPAEEIDEFNNHIKNSILILKAFYGENYEGITTINTCLKEKNYLAQLIELKKLREFNLMDYTCEILTQWKIITQNYFLWLNIDLIDFKIGKDEKKDLLFSIRQIMLRNKKWFIKE